MAGSVQTTTPDAWVPEFDTILPQILVKNALDGNSAYARRLAKEPDFTVTARQDVSGETTTLIDLTARGVTFPAGTQRVIEYEVYVSGNTAATESGYLHARNMVVGGTTPVLGIVIGAVDTNMAGAVGGFTGSDPSVQFALATNNVTITATNEGATEINNIVLKVYVGKLQPVVLGV